MKRIIRYLLIVNLILLFGLAGMIQASSFRPYTSATGGTADSLDSETDMVEGDVAFVVTAPGVFTPYVCKASNAAASSSVVVPVYISNTLRWHKCSYDGDGSAVTGVNATLLGGHAASYFQPAGSYLTRTGDGSGLVNLSKTQVGLENVNNVEQIPLSFLNSSDDTLSGGSSKIPTDAMVAAYVAAHAGEGGGGTGATALSELTDASISSPQDLQALVYRTSDSLWHNYSLGTGAFATIANYVPTSRTVNGYPLSSNVSLTYSDVGAAATSHNHAASAITSGTIGLAYGGLGASLSDPGFNGFLGWDDTDNSVSFWHLGTGLTYDHSTHTISSSAAAGSTTFDLIGTGTNTSGATMTVGNTSSLTYTGTGTINASTLQGNAASAFAAAGHTHDYSSVYEAKDATILKSAAIGVTVQGYDAILAALAGLANSSGILTNDGNGNLSWGAGTGSGDMLAEDYPNIVAIDAVTPSVGYLHWNGSAYVYDTPSGSEHDAVTLGASLTNILTLTDQELSLGSLGATLGTLADTSGVTASQYWGSDGDGVMGYHDLPASGGLADIVDDTTPQLGGDLDVNGKEIQSSGNIVFQLGDNSGTNKFSIQDSDGAEVLSIDSNGQIAQARASGEASSHYFYEDPDNGDNYEIIRAAASLSANLTFTLPDAYPEGDGYIATVSSTGVISYTDPSTLGGGTGLTDTDYGDVTVSSNGTVMTVDGAGGIVFDASPDSEGDFGYASNAFGIYANSENLFLTASGNTWTLSSTTGVDTFDFGSLISHADSLGIGSSTVITSIDTDLSSVSENDDTLATAKAIRAYIDSFFSISSDGFFRMFFPNNTSISPTASTNELYVEGNKFKFNENGTEKTAANLDDAQTFTSLIDFTSGIRLAASQYMNFGATSGTNGYGFRDNSGTLQWKNSGGAWADISSGGGDVTASSTTEFTNKTLDANATGNVVKGYGYITFKRPNQIGSAMGAVVTTTTSYSYGMPSFSGTVETDNYMTYIAEVPRDIDTTVDLVAYFKFRLTADDTGDHDYYVSMISLADSSDMVTQAASVAYPINLAYTADGSGAANDIETATATLTDWKDHVTAGQLWIIRVTRDGDDETNDSSSDVSYPVELTIRYGFTQ